MAAKRISAIYLRVSTEDQNPDNQVEDLRKWADVLGYKIIEIYVDKDSGGYSDRIEFQRMIADAEAQKFEVVFIWALDRFSREGAGMTLTYIERLRKAGVALKSFHEQWIDTSDEGNAELTISILAWQAKQERTRIRERTMAGKHRVLREGKIIGCNPPFGYEKVGEKGESRFEVDRREAGIVRLMFKTFLETQSVGETARKLNELEIKGKKGAVLHKATIRLMLSNESYIGNWYWGKTSIAEAKYHIKEVRKSRLTGRKVNKREDWKMVQIPTIIEKPVFNKVQEILTKRSEEHTHSTKYFYLCQGLIRCAHCNRIYNGRRDCNKWYTSSSGELHQRKTFYFSYICPQKYQTHLGQPKCHARKMSVRKLDSLVWDYVEALISDPEEVKKKIREMEERRQGDRTYHEKNHEVLVSGRADVKRRKTRLLGLYAKDEKYSEDDLDNAMEQLILEEQDFERQIREIGIELKKIENMKELEREVERVCADYEKRLVEPTDEEKKVIVRAWVKHINLLDDGVVRIRTHIPEPEYVPLVLNNVSSQDLVFVHTQVSVRDIEFELEFQPTVGIKGVWNQSSQ